MNPNLPPFVWYEPSEDDFYQQPLILMSQEFRRRWYSRRHSFPQSKADCVSLSEFYHSCQCWSCNKYYHITSPTCQFCDAANGNVDLKKALQEHFDKENHLQEVADLLRKIGWDNPGDAQLTELRANIGNLRHLLIGPPKPTTLDLQVNGKVVGTVILTLPSSIGYD